MKRKNDTPAGGWLGPASDGGHGLHATHFATSTKLVRGKREWDWKPITEKFKRDCDKRLREIKKDVR
jgi:hypothetical protein